MPGSKNIEDPATKRKFSGLAHRIGTQITLYRQKFGKPCRTDSITSTQLHGPVSKVICWRHPLQNRVYSGQNGRTAPDLTSAAICLMHAKIGQPGKRFDPVADKPALR